MRSLFIALSTFETLLTVQQDAPAFGSARCCSGFASPPVITAPESFRWNDVFRSKLPGLCRYLKVTEPFSAIERLAHE